MYVHVSQTGSDKILCGEREQRIKGLYGFHSSFYCHLLLLYQTTEDPFSILFLQQTTRNDDSYFLPKVLLGCFFCSQV